MTRKEKILIAVGIGVLLLMLCFVADADAQATDTYVGACAAQDQCILATGQSWASGNQVWRFTAFYKSESIRIWIRNNNPTSAHTSQTVQVWITDEPNVAQLIGLTSHWTQAVVTDNSIIGAKCTNLNANADASAPGANGKGTCYTVGMYAVQVAVRITGANAQTGNPDTFDIGVVQQPSNNPGGPQPGADTSTGGYTGSGGDPCATQLNRTTLSFSLASTGAYSQVQSGSAGKIISVCALSGVVSQGGTSGAALNLGSDGTAGCGASGSFVSKYQLGANALPTNSVVPLNLGSGNSTLFQLPVGSGLCQAAVAGVGGLTQFTMVFVQQ